MSVTTSSGDPPPLALGAAAGVVAWLIGYALFFLVVSPSVQDSAIQRFIEAVEGEPATYEMVGWVFYNSHMVDTVVTDIPGISDQATNFIGGDDGFSVFLYVIPVALLLIAGLAVGRSQGVTDISTGLVAGLTLVPGYLLLSVAGLFLFEATIAGSTVGPQRLQGLFLVGLVYPAGVGGLGGALAAATATETTGQR